METKTDISREEDLARIFAKPLWDENDLAVLLNVEVETIRHMKVRGEIAAIVQVNKRCWRVSRDAYIEHFKVRGMPKKGRGRPPKRTTE